MNDDIFDDDMYENDSNIMGVYDMQYPMNPVERVYVLSMRCHRVSGRCILVYKEVVDMTVMKWTILGGPREIGYYHFYCFFKFVHRDEV